MQPVDWRALGVPEAVLGKVQALGPAGEQWLRDLPERLQALTRAWDLTLGPVLPGGSAAYVVAATTADGADVVLKVHLPGYDDLSTEIRVLQIAGGRGYVRLLRWDLTQGAMLQERLGPRLSTLGFSTARQMEIICATLEQAWVRAPGIETFPSGADKARWLHAFIGELWQALDRPCSERVIEHALELCDRRAAGFDPARAVLVHGDAHSANTLAPYRAPAPAQSGYKLIDPDGLFAERAYDLAILMRDWNQELLAGDPLRLGRERAALLSRLTGEDEELIWQWGCIERVSTGLLLLHTGMAPEGRDYLRVAEAWLVE